MKVGLLVDIKDNFEEKIRHAKSLGFDFGQLVVWDMDFYTEENLQNLKKLLSELDFTVTELANGGRKVTTVCRVAIANISELHVFDMNDPEQKLREIEADPGTPGQSFGASNTFKSPEVLNWIERDETIEQDRLDTIWGYLYAAIREGADFPITLEQAVDVIKYIDLAKKSSRFGKGE